MSPCTHSLSRLSLRTASPSPPKPRCTGAVNENSRDIEMSNVSRRQRRNDHDHGVFLSWEKLHVSAYDGNAGRRVPILHGLDGYALPGEVLAVMGPSGGGKTTLLDALAGRLAPNVEQTGEILINGRREKLAFGTSAYVTQDDVLMTTLTVREAVYYSSELQLPASMPRAEKRARADETMRGMGLAGAMDTRIGGRASKGISRGQRRRVSICIEILTRPRLLFLDELTSGLDSAASYHVMNRITGLARREGMTVVVAVHEPGSEVFELFHDLCLLAYGKTVYFGPASETTTFFAVNGFPCPELRKPSDHFLRVINKDFDEDLEEGLGAIPATSTHEAIEMLVKSYKLSVYSEQVRKKKAMMCGTEGSLVKKRDEPSFTTQTAVLTKRSFVNMYRDLGYYWLRLAIYVGLGICVGTIYHEFGYSFESIQARGAMLGYIAGFLTFMSIGGFPSFVEDMKIFGRERLNGHYGVTSFMLANTFSSIPFLALISVVPGAMAYYLAGLQRGADHFAYFSLVLFMSVILVESLMMIVASAVPDYLMGIITGAGIQGVMILSCGFFQLPHRLPKVFWMYPTHYAAFHKYAYQGFLKNEFLGLSLPSSRTAGEHQAITGKEILRDVWNVDVRHSKWVDLAVLLGMFAVYRVLFLVIVKMSEKVKPAIANRLWRRAGQGNPLPNLHRDR